MKALLVSLMAAAALAACGSSGPKQAAAQTDTPTRAADGVGGVWKAARP